MQAEHKLLGMLGLSARAGRISSGEFAVENGIRSFKSRLVVIAADASDNTRKKFLDKCSFYGVPCAVVSDRSSLGRAVGKDLRAVISVNDGSFAEAMIKLLKEGNVDFHDNALPEGMDPGADEDNELSIR